MLGPAHAVRRDLVLVFLVSKPLGLHCDAPLHIGHACTAQQCLYELLSGSRERVRPVELRFLRHWRAFRDWRPVTQGAVHHLLWHLPWVPTSAKTLVRRSRCVQFFWTWPTQWVAFDTLKQQFPKLWIMALHTCLHPLRHMPSVRRHYRGGPALCLLSSSDQVRVEHVDMVARWSLSVLESTGGTYDPDDGDVGCHFRRFLSVGMKINIAVFTPALLRHERATLSYAVRVHSVSVSTDLHHVLGFFPASPHALVRAGSTPTSQRR